MPAVSRNQASVYYECHGAGPTVVFVPTGGFGPWQWAWQYPAVSGPFRTVVYHPRGTGQSSAQPPAETVPPLVADLRAVVAALDTTAVHLVGFGAGGRVALEYTHQYAHVHSLTLLQTPAGEPTIDVDAAMLTPTADQQIATSRLLSDSFVQSHPSVVDQINRWRQDEDAPPAYWEALTAVLPTTREWPLYTVTTPTLIVHGGADTVIPEPNAQTLITELPRSRDIVFDDAAHLVGVERSRPVNDALRGFLEDHTESS